MCLDVLNYLFIYLFISDNYGPYNPQNTHIHRQTKCKQRLYVQVVRSKLAQDSNHVVTTDRKHAKLQFSLYWSFVVLPVSVARHQITRNFGRIFNIRRRGVELTGVALRIVSQVR